MKRTNFTAVLLSTGVLLLVILGLISVMLLWGPAKDLIAGLREKAYFGLGRSPKAELVVQVQVQDAVKAEADRTIDLLIEALGQAGIAYSAIERNDPGSIQEAGQIRIEIRGVPPNQAEALRNLVADRFGVWMLAPDAVPPFRLTLRPSELTILRQQAVGQTVETLQRRLRALGAIARVLPQPGPGDAPDILVQVAARTGEPGRLKQLLSSHAQLEITGVEDGPFPNRESALAKYAGALPPNSRLAPTAARGQAGQGWYLLNRRPVITGRDLRSARPAQDENGRWETDFTLAAEGAGRFARFTESNIGKRLAIVLDNQVLSAPTIQTRIEGSGRITGVSSQQEAADLALLLRSGALPAGIVFLEERTLP
jgi:preprotein translocase subunit SecD